MPEGSPPADAASLIPTRPATANVPGERHTRLSGRASFVRKTGTGDAVTAILDAAGVGGTDEIVMGARSGAPGRERPGRDR